MAEQRRLAELNYGFPGSLTFIPPEEQQNGLEELFTSRVVDNASYFSIVGSSTEIYPPSKTRLPPLPSHLWQERRIQRRWLLNAQSEAFMGNSVFDQYLKEDMDNSEGAKEPDHRGHLLAIGQMTNLQRTVSGEVLPLLATATGSCGEVLRLTRIRKTDWQWDDNEDVYLRLRTVETANLEEQTLWTSDTTPILHIKFVSYHSGSAVPWLLVQTSLMSTILQPTFHSVPLPEGVSKQDIWAAPASLIQANPVLTLSRHQTGGNANSDSCYSPTSQYGRPQWIIIDECGYWTIWNIIGKFQRGKNTLRLSFHARGHISGQEILHSHCLKPTIEQHGAFYMGTHQIQSKPPLNTMKTEPAMPRYLVLWNSTKFEVLDLAEMEPAPLHNAFPSSTSKKIRILDCQVSPRSKDHVFVLTSEQLFWINFCYDTQMTQFSLQTENLLSCLHFGTQNDGIRMSLACASEEDNDTTVLVYLYSPHTEQLCMYSFSLSTPSRLPQWHRSILQLPDAFDCSSHTGLRFLASLPAKLHNFGTKSARSSMERSVQTNAKFLQLNMLDEQLSLRYCICAVSNDPTTHIVPPTRPAEWSINGQRSSKKLRKQLRYYMDETFVVPDSMNDPELKFLYDLGDVRVVSDGEDNKTSARGVMQSNPRLFDFDLVCQAVGEKLCQAVWQEGHGVPLRMLEGLHRAIDRGLTGRGRTLMTWFDMAEELKIVAANQNDENATVEDIQHLFDRSDGRVVVTELHQRSDIQLSDSSIDLASVQRSFIESWLNLPMDGSGGDIDEIRRAWGCEIAKDVFMSSHGILVQEVPLFRSVGAGNGVSGPEASGPLPSGGKKTPSKFSALTPPASPRLNPPADGAFERLKLLAPTLEPGKLGARKQAKLLSFWPAERGIDTQEYTSSVQIASEEMFADAKVRLQKIEARRKTLADRYRVPAFIGRGFPTDDQARQRDARLPIRTGPIQIMSSQLAPPDSSQSQSQGYGERQPTLTMSQPLQGAYANRKKTKKVKRPMGFR